MPSKIKFVGFVFAARICHEHRTGAVTNKFFFSKNEWPKKPEVFSINFDCCHLNQGRRRTLSVLPGPDLTLGASP
jgi:hypothetical protein